MPEGVRVTVERGASRRTVLWVLVAVPVATGCASSTPDEGSWRLHARRAVSDVLSGVQTARLSLEQALAERIHDAYLQTVVVDAEETAGGSAERFSSEQPPGVERDRYDAVTGRLDEATSLLASVRIAVVAGRTEAYRGLMEELQTTADRLTRLEDDLRHPPRNRIPS